MPNTRRNRYQEAQDTPPLVRMSSRRIVRTQHARARVGTSPSPPKTEVVAAAAAEATQDVSDGQAEKGHASVRGKRPSLTKWAALLVVTIALVDGMLRLNSVDNGGGIAVGRAIADPVSHRSISTTPRVLVFAQHNAQGIQALRDHVLTAGNPLHAAAFYAPHLNVGQINAMVRHPQAPREVGDALSHHGWDCDFDGGAVFTCYWRNEDSGAASRTLPQLQNHTFVDMVVPIGAWRGLGARIRRGRHLQSQNTPSELERSLITTAEDARLGVGSAVVPPTLHTRYAITDTMAGTPGRTSVAPCEFEDYGGFSQEDLDVFVKDTGLPPSAAKVQCFGTKASPAAREPSSITLESTLDMQYVAATAPGAQLAYWTFDDWILDGAYTLFNNTHRPDIVSWSWGWSEDHQCDVATCEDSAAYVQRANEELLKLTATGTTIVTAAGDAGAHGRTDEDCKAQAPLAPAFPASSPWVVSVGATSLVGTTLTTDPSFAPLCKHPLGARGVPCVTSATGEQPAMLPQVGWTTGGGFSHASRTPTWQQSSVATYLHTVNGDLPPATEFNAHGRGMPDLSAVGHDLYIRMRGAYQSADGTSASAPIVAGLLSHISEALRDTNRHKLGFANGLLYFASLTCPDCFLEDTRGPHRVVGRNDCTEVVCCDTGFPTAHGDHAGGVWDPVMGLGGLNVSGFVRFVTAAACPRY